MKCTKVIYCALIFMVGVIGCGDSDEGSDSSCSSYFHIGSNELTVYSIHGSPDSITNSRCVRHIRGKVIITICGRTLVYGEDTVDIWNGKVQTVNNKTGSLCIGEYSK